MELQRNSSSMTPKVNTTKVKFIINTTSKRLFQKNPNRGVEDMEFPDELKKEHVENPGVFKKNPCRISMGLGF